MAIKTLNGVAAASIKTLNGVAAASAKTWNGITAGVGGYTCDAADFDGTNDYMTRGADLTGSSDSATGTLVLWVRFDGGDGVSQTLFRNEIGHIAFVKNGTVNSNKLDLQLTSPTSQVFNCLSTTTYTAASGWKCFLMSWNLSFGGASNLFHMYDGDTSIKDTPTADPNPMIVDYTSTNWSIGAATNGSAKSNGCFAEFWFAQGTYIDFTVQANRRKFYSASGKPVDLGPNGSTPTGSQPIVYQRVADGAAASTFATNLGAGGNFSITGSLDVCSTSPSD